MGLDKLKILLQISDALTKINNPNHHMTVADKKNNNNRTICVFLLIWVSYDNVQMLCLCIQGKTYTCNRLDRDSEGPYEAKLDLS